MFRAELALKSAFWPRVGGGKGFTISTEMGSSGSHGTAVRSLSQYFQPEIPHPLAAYPGSLDGKMQYLAVLQGRILTAEMKQLDVKLPVK